MTQKTMAYWVEADLSTKARTAEFESVPLSRRGLPSSTYRMLEHACAAYPEKTAIWFLASGLDTPETASATTFGQLWRRINQTANLLASLDVGKDDVVSVLMPAVTESQFILWGAQAAGVVCPLNWMLEPGIIAGMIEAAASRVLVVYGGDEDVDLWQKVEAVIALQPGIRVVLSVGGRRPERDAVAGVPVIDYAGVIDRYPGGHLASGRDIQGGDIAALFHTGGTTGAPKLARQTHAAEVFSTWAYGMAYGTVAEDIRSCGIPIFHVGGALANCLHTLVRGATLVLMTSVGWRHPSVIPNFWRIVAAFRVTAASLVPTVINQLLRVPVGDNDIRSLAAAGTGTAPLSVHVAQGFLRLTGVPLLETYGMTESTSVTTSNPRHGMRKTGSAGLPFPYQRIRVVRVPSDGDGLQDCSVGEPGLIVIAGPAVFDGYVDASANKGLFLEDGWLNTGDLGYLDADGYLWITGRAKDLIIRGGHNIDPQVVEEAFFKHPDVVDVAVIGAPDSHSGEVPVAYLVLKPGSACDAAQMLKYGAAAIPERAAIPKACFLLESLPKTSVGKTQKNTLRADATQRAYALALSGAQVPGIGLVQAVDRGAQGILCRIEGAGSDERGFREAVRHALGAYTIPYEIAYSGV